VIWVRREPEYFCQRDWTGGIELIPQGIFPPSFRGIAKLMSPELIITIGRYGFRACAKWRIPDVQLHIGE
jgi:hypothetical protein